VVDTPSVCGQFRWLGGSTDSQNRRHSGNERPASAPFRFQGATYWARSKSRGFGTTNAFRVCDSSSALMAHMTDDAKIARGQISAVELLFGRWVCNW
jgi:hypothetical protein